MDASCNMTLKYLNNENPFPDNKWKDISYCEDNYVLNEQNFIFRKINIIDPKKCKEKDCNFSINLLLSFLEKNKMKMYYQEINKNNITKFLSM